MESPISGVRKLSINYIHFPKMKSKSNMQSPKSKRVYKNQVQNQRIQNLHSRTNLKRTSSVNLLPFRKQVKTMLTSPRKRFSNIQNENWVTNKQQENGQVLMFGEELLRKLNLGNSNSKYNKRLSLLDLRIDLKRQLKEYGSKQNEKNILENQFPGIKLSSGQGMRRSMSLNVKNSRRRMERQNLIEDLSYGRQSRKKPLFNGKMILTKRSKQGFAQQLVMRKLMWEGRQRERIEERREMMMKMREERHQLFDVYKSQQSNKNNGDEIYLSAWEDNEQYPSKIDSVQKREK